MRSWAAARPLRWLTLIVTTWCLNADAVRAALVNTGRSAEQTSPAPVSALSVTTSQTLTRHPSPVVDRCGCHSGLVLPLGLTVFAWAPRPTAEVAAIALELPQILPTAPESRPPVL